MCCHTVRLFAPERRVAAAGFILFILSILIKRLCLNHAIAGSIHTDHSRFFLSPIDDARYIRKDDNTRFHRNHIRR